MIEPTLDSLRVFAHLFAVATWMGGQVVLASIVPGVRRHSPGALTPIAKGFAKVAWPSMVLIVFTGVWGLASIDVTERDSTYHATFGIKLLLVAAAIIATVIHSQGTSKAAKAVGGAVGLAATVLAAYAGVLMAHV
jgi:putative copper export protein